MNGCGHGAPPCRQVLQQTDQVHGCGAVQPTGGLVQHDDGGVDQQLVADGHTLALTTTDTTPEEATCMQGR